MTLPHIMEGLLRSRLYRRQVIIRTTAGDQHEVLVRDVRYEGSRPFVVVVGPARAAGEFAIPLHVITSVIGPARRVSRDEGVA